MTAPEWKPRSKRKRWARKGPTPNEVKIEFDFGLKSHLAVDDVPHRRRRFVKNSGSILWRVSISFDSHYYGAFVDDVCFRVHTRCEIRTPVVVKKSALYFVSIPIAQPLLLNCFFFQLFPALSTTPLFGLLEGRFVWVPADERTAKLLDGACVGTPAGGARSAADAAGAAAAVFGPDAVSASVSEERGGPGVCVRLSLEEAVFLVHVLGTLRVVVEQKQQQRGGGGEDEEGEGEEDEKKKMESGGGGGRGEEPPARVAREMDGEELWRYACLQASSSKGGGGRGDENGDDEEDDENDDEEAFLRSYVAFHHFRCKGWTVRSGLRYGCDFVLYQGHPAASHADVCVLAVRRGGDGGGERSGSGGNVDGKATTTTTKKKKASLPRAAPSFFTARDSPSRRAGPLTWLDVEIGNRLAAQVGKRLLLLHVQVSRDGGEGEGEGAGGGGGASAASRHRFSLLSLTAAEALSRVTVEERLVERWVPDVDREEPVV